jgi:Ca2+-binding RTX toxin-like protein
MPATVSSIIGPGMGEFHIGDTVLFTVTFSEAVTVTGEPYLQLSNGAQAIYESISPDLMTLTFSYLVAEGDDTLDLEVEANQLFLNAGSITDATLAPADLAIVPGTDPAGVASIDATRPTLDISAQHVGNQVTLLFTFSEAVQGFDVTDIPGVNGLTLDAATFVNDPTNPLVYKVEGTLSVGAQIEVAGTAFTDTVGNDGVGDTLDLDVLGNTLTGTNGNDRVDLSGSNHKRHLQSTDDNDTIFTLRGNDKVDAGDGNDLINAGLGIDKVAAGAGDDTIEVKGREAEHDKMGGGAGHDTIELIGTDPVTLFGFNAKNSSIEALVTNDLTIRGSNGADKFDFSGLKSAEGKLILSGGGGADRLIGSDFADDLRGGNARDLLAGGKGDDCLTGGRHNDVFVFAKDFGNDEITDFGDRPSDQDVLKLVGYGPVLAAEFADWKAEHVSDLSGKVVITLDTETITLANVTSAHDIGFTDFLFS